MIEDVYTSTKAAFFLPLSFSAQLFFFPLRSYQILSKLIVALNIMVLGESEVDRDEEKE